MLIHLLYLIIGFAVGTVFAFGMCALFGPSSDASRAEEKYLDKE